MSKDRQRRPAAKNNAAVMGDRTGKGDCPAIVVGIGGSAGGAEVAEAALRQDPRRARRGLCGHPAPRTWAGESDRQAAPGSNGAGRGGGNGRDAGAGGPHSPPAARQVPQHRRIQADPSGTGALQRAADADRPFFLLAGRGPARPRVRNFALRDRRRRHPRTVGDQGRGGKDVCGRPRQRGDLRHAAERHRRGRGGRRSAGRGHGGSDRSAGGAGEGQDPQ